MNKFLTEILEQPESLSATLDYYCSSEGAQKLDKISDIIRTGNYEQIIFTGMGSSFFISYSASCLFNSLGLNSCAIDTSELIYYHGNMINKNNLLFCISQSGESFEVVKLLEELPEQTCCIGICNEEESSLARMAAETLFSKAGKEEMTSSKTYTTILLVLTILGWRLSGKWGKEKVAQVKQFIADSSDLLSYCQANISDEIDFIGDVEFMQFIARGPVFANAGQSELMFKEAVKVPAASAFGGEFRHGPMEMVQPGFNAVIFVPDGLTYVQGIRMTQDIAEFQGKVILITNKDPELTNKNIKVISINQADEYLFLIQSIMPVQLMVNQLALARGIKPGNFVHGGKVTISE